MILGDIFRAKHAELLQVKRRVSLDDLRRRPLFHAPRMNFAAALRSRQRAIIAEVKKASPSKGVIREDFDPVWIAETYARSGAAAISVLTEEKYFQGSLEYLAAIRMAVGVPLLRKDFLFDPYQLFEARAYGADAALLIVAMLSDEELRELQFVCEELNLTALVEVHDRHELERAIAAGATVIGINNRDLRTFHVSLATTEDLMPMTPRDVLVVAESGIETAEDLRRLECCGVRAFLVGESLMRRADPGEMLAEFLG